MPVAIPPSASPTTTTAFSALLDDVKPIVPRHLDLPADMSIGELMEWLSSRMKKSDEDIRSKMNDIEGRKVQQEELSKIVQALRSSKKNPEDDGVILDAPLDNPQAIKDAPWYKALNSEDKASLGKLLDCIKTGYRVTDYSFVPPKTTIMTKEELAARKSGMPALITPMPARLDGARFDDAITNVGDLAKSINSRDEMEMIKLQSDIARRGQLLQMVSNMVASFNGTAKDIVGNMR